jgi:hypothetical protein
MKRAARAANVVNAVPPGETLAAAYPFWRRDAQRARRPEVARQTKAQKKTVERVMHEFKHGELETGTGAKVKNPRQAIAIALSEAGASDQQSPKENKQRLAKTKAKERTGRTAMQEKEGKGAKTRGDLYEEAKKRDIPGRSKMSKAHMEKALAK